MKKFLFSKTSKQLQSILLHLPHSPGVYKFLNDKKSVIYVGKAKDLKKRVSQYFTKMAVQSVRMQKLVQSIFDIQYIEVGSELEAVFLETHLIKEIRPRFNILMKDDKNYVYIRVTTQEDFPRISIVRKREKDQARYFGPQTSATKAKITLKLLKKLFPYRHCNLNIVFNPKLQNVTVSRAGIKYPCLDYHIHRCIGPCIASCTPKEYSNIMKKVIHFLEGKQDELVSQMKREMEKAVTMKNFELAASIRDKLYMIERVMERQRVSDPSSRNQDIINYLIRTGKVYFNLFMVREGKLINQENFIFQSGELADDEKPGEILEAFFTQYYEKASDFPDEILIPEHIANQEVVQEWLRSLHGKKIDIVVPQKGKKNELLILAKQNAESFAHQSEARFLSDEKRTLGACKRLSKLLCTDREIRRIEGYDISHLGGTEIVGSMVVFYDGMPKKSDYRRFRIKIAPKKIDDYMDLKEVLGRRLRKLSSNKSDVSVDGTITFRNGLKKDIAFIADVLKRESLDDKAIVQKQFIVAVSEVSKIIVGFGRIQEVSLSKTEKVGLLSSLWVDEAFRHRHIGQEIIVRLLKKIKYKKVFSINICELEDYYGALGFHIAQKMPSIFLKKMKHCACRSSCMGKKLILMVYRVQKVKHDASFKKIPDLLLIDGGKGQLSSVCDILKAYQLHIPVIGLAKKYEEIFLPNRPEPLVLPHDDSALHLLQRVRDEAHRFAHEHHSTLRNKAMFH